jgi:hypothetical protein
MIELNGGQEFLVRPHPKGTESIRSLLHRLIRQNKLSPRLLGESQGVAHATATALALAASAGWHPENILRRGGLIATPGIAEGTISVGISRLGKRSFVGNQRRICPQCIANRSDTPLAWEIYVNRACHFHGCLLVDRCSSCEEPFEWLTYDLVCSSCGNSLSQMTTHQAPRWARTLSQWVHMSVSRSIRGIREDGRQVSDIFRVRLDKLLLMVDVLRHVLLRRWLNARVWDQFNMPWTVELLKSHDFRFWLWNALFLHAAKDPMTLAKALVPSGTGLASASFFDHFSTNAPIPLFILESLRHLKERRLVSQLSSLEIFDPRLHGIRPVMQVMSRFGSMEGRCDRTHIRELHEQVLEDEEAGILVSPC